MSALKRSVAKEDDTLVLDSDLTVDEVKFCAFFLVGATQLLNIGVSKLTKDTVQGYIYGALTKMENLEVFFLFLSILSALFLKFVQTATFNLVQRRSPHRKKYVVCGIYPQIDNLGAPS